MTQSHEHTADQHGHESHGGHGHIVPIPMYLAVFSALMVMTAVTVAVAYVDLGPLNIFVALAIAIFKASLVVLIFMHVWWSSRLVQLAAAAGFIWLAIMLSFTFADIGTRSWQDVQGWAPQFVDEAVMGGGEHGGAGEHAEEEHAPEGGAEGGGAH